MDHKYRKRPVVIEAFQMTKERLGNKNDWPDWLSEACQKDHREVNSINTIGSIEEIHSIYPVKERHEFAIKTLEGYMKVSWNDYIIQGVEGELYSCKPNIFEKTYEKVILAYLD